MEIYILTQLIEEFESEAAKPDMNTDMTKVTFCLLFLFVIIKRLQKKRTICIFV